MVRVRLIAAITGVIAVGMSVGTASAGGPPGAVDDSPGPPGTYGAVFSAVGSGTFAADGHQVEVGYNTYGKTADEAEAALLAECRGDGGQNCSADEVTNDDLCIVVAFDDVARIQVGGAGPTIRDAQIAAVARAAANGTPINPAAPVLISDCP